MVESFDPCYVICSNTTPYLRVNWARSMDTTNTLFILGANSTKNLMVEIPKYALYSIKTKPSRNQFNLKLKLMV